MFNGIFNGMFKGLAPEKVTRQWKGMQPTIRF